MIKTELVEVEKSTGNTILRNQANPIYYLFPFGNGM